MVCPNKLTSTCSACKAFMLTWTIFVCVIVSDIGICILEEEPITMGVNNCGLSPVWENDMGVFVIVIEIVIANVKNNNVDPSNLILV